MHWLHREVCFFILQNEHSLKCSEVRYLSREDSGIDCEPHLQETEERSSEFLMIKDIEGISLQRGQKKILGSRFEVVVIIKEK